MIKCSSQKLRKIVCIAAASMLLTGCGQQAAKPDPQGDAVAYGSSYSSVDDATMQAMMQDIYGDTTYNTSDMTNMQVDGSEEKAFLPATPRLFFEALQGTFTYKTGNTEGALFIGADPEGNGIKIADYINAEEPICRFNAYDSYCDGIEGNSVFMSYPEVRYSREEVRYSYYIFVSDGELIDVYHSDESFETAQFLYTAYRVAGQ